MQDVNADGGQPRAGESIEAEKRIAHSGALARWAGHCARHPKRVVFTWLGVFVLLIGLNAAFHGKLINDFKIPGSDTQKATDLITAKFGAEKGAALRVVLAAPAGQRADTAARSAAIRRMVAAGYELEPQRRIGFTIKGFPERPRTPRAPLFARSNGDRPRSRP